MQNQVKKNSAARRRPRAASSSLFLPSVAALALAGLCLGRASRAVHANSFAPEPALDDQQQQQQQHQDQLTDSDADPDGDAATGGQVGSWSHWWSYDGISGPDYWNINKRWRLCSLGRKQSPIDIRTEQLLYDHLLGPLELDWRPRRPAATTTAAASQLEARSGPAGEQQRQRETPDQQTIPVRLINSGRGIEAWLERAPPFDLSQAGGGAAPPHAHAHLGERPHWVLARGPLAYEYKLFKMELHSAASFASGAGQSARAPVQSRPQSPLHSQESGVDESAGGADKPPAGPTSSSEHLIDGRAFEAELQLHFYNARLAPGGARDALRMASEQPFASLFAIISVFVSLRPTAPTGNTGAGASADEQSRANETSTTTRPARPHAQAEQPLDFLFGQLARLQNQGDQVELTLARRQLEALVPDARQYVTYQGSLNRPPCAESVDWIILNKALLVDARKFAQLFELTNTNVENVRPAQPAHGRLLRTTISTLATLGPASDAARPPATVLKCSRAGAGLKTHAECRAANGTEDQAASGRQRLLLDGAHPSQRRPPQCSMKPHYSYRFSYAANKLLA